MAVAFALLYPQIDATLKGQTHDPGGGALGGIITIGLFAWFIIALVRDHRAGLWRWWWKD